MPDQETRIAALENARKDLEDAMIVMAHLEKGQSERLKEHASFIAGHERSMKDHETRMRNLDERIEKLDERIEKLVSAIGEWIRKS